MKRIYTLQVILSFLLISVKVFSYDFKVDGLCYNKLSDNTVELTWEANSPYIGNIVVPNYITYNGRRYEVIAIGENAMVYMLEKQEYVISYRENTQLYSVSLPTTIISIGNQAFLNCSSLTSITIPNSVTSIGNEAFSRCSGLTSITIPNSVTSIGYSAFRDCSGLTSVTIPNSVTSIDNYVFSDCSGLTSIAIPNSVTSIGNGAFENCSALTSIAIPNNVTSIGDYAFSYCSSLISITIPNSVTSIGSSAFKGCSGLTSIKVESGNSKYDSRNNCNAIIETATNTLLVGCKNTTIPNSVTSIGDYAFSYCSSLISITIPNSVTSIGYGAFSGCSGLTSITIPNSVTSMGSSAFYQCSSLISITIPNSVTSMGDHAFSGCSGLTSITILNGVTSIGYYAFSGCSGLTSITIPNSVTSIGNSAFQGCSGLASIKVESGNNKYDSRNNCNAIIETATNTMLAGCKNTTIPNSVTSIGNSAFYACSLTSITIPNSVTSIGNNAFYGCSGLTSITILYSVTSIGSSAFYNCSGLTSITIPNSVTSIGDEAFYKCSSLASVNSDILNPFKIGGDVFSGISSNAVLQVPKGTKSKYEAISGWSKNFKEIVEGGESSAQRTIHVATAGTLANLISESEKYTIEELTLTGQLNGTDFRLLRDMAGCNYLGDETAGRLKVLDMSGAKVVAGGGKYVDTDYLPGWSDSFHYTVDKNNELPQHIFHGCKFTSVCIPNSVTLIGDATFCKCSSLTSITIANSVTSIGDNAFWGCGSLTSITIPNSVTSIGSYAFQNCSALTSIAIPNSVTSIGTYSFSGCSSLTSVNSDIQNPFGISENVFSSETYSRAKLTVPYGTKSKYQSMYYWNKFSNIVEKAPEQSITITARSYSREYGEANPTFGYSVSGGAISGTPKITCSATKTSPVGTYAIQIEKGSVTNDNVTFVNGTLTITKATLTITAKSYTRKKGEANPTFEVTYSGFKNNETEAVLSRKPTVTCSATSSSPVGTYAITASGAQAANYNFSYVQGVLTVTEESQGQMPAGYTEVEYIQAPKEYHSNSHVWTVPNDLQENYNYIFEFTPLSWEDSYYGYMIGGHDGDSAFPNYGIYKLDNGWGGMEKRFIAAFWNYNLETRLSSPGGNYRVYSGVRSRFQLHCKNYDSSQGAEIVIENEGYQKYSHTSTTIFRSGYSVKTGKYNISLFTPTGDSYYRAAFMQLHKFKVEDKNGKAIYDYVPCKRKSDSKVGLYDVVNGAFYYPSAFTLTAGPEVHGGTTKRTIHVATAGTLPNLISESEKYTIEELTLTGQLNGTDFRLLRDMAGCNYLGDETAGKLKVLDMSGANIVAGGEKYLDTDHLPGSSGSFHYIVDKNDKLPQFVFCGCKFTSVGIPNSVTLIGSYAFYGCSGLTSITIPNSVTSIGSSAFEDCSGLTSITIPNSVTSIGSYAFYGCSSLISVTIPNSVTSIGDRALANCRNMAIIKVESGNNKYDSRNDCNAIIETVTNTLLTGCKNTTIPNSVTSIGNQAFWACRDLTSITIPNSVTSIGNYAFYNCRSLASITIPNSVTSIGNSAFYYCSSLSSITIPNSVTLIGSYAFQNCSSLTSITIPNSVTSIGDYAFFGCSSLTSVNSDIQNPFGISEYVFSSGTYSKAKLTVPSGTKSKYQSTNYWNKFSNIVEKAPEQSITITARSYSRLYGEANPTFEYTVNGGSISGTPKITCSATKTSPVGTYTIQIEKGSVTNDNVTYVNGTLTIAKATLTITAKSYTRKKGEANPTFEVTYSGFKNNETEAVLTKKPTVTCSATSSSPVGTYAITPSGAQAANYNFSYVQGVLTVTEESQVSFSSNGITYTGLPSTQKATVASVDNTLRDVVIPAIVNYGGKAYQVTSVANSALSNRTFNYVSLPSTITSVSSSTFANTMLGALVWKASTSLTSSVFSNMAMPVNANFLLYVNSKSYAPSNVANVVVGGSASTITLSDATNTCFYCPEEFTAQTISYTHHYGMTTGGGKGWETIALPFDVQKIEHKTKGTVTPFASYQEGSDQRPFWLCELGGNGFKKSDVIKANTPYIISMPNSTSYDSEYILSGDVVFSATNVKVRNTGNVNVATSNGKTFKPAFAVTSASSAVYPLNATNNLVTKTGGYDPGSRFISNLRTVYPFEAYMETASSSRVISISFDDETTGIEERILFADQGKGRVRVYSLGGQLLIDSSVESWEPLWQQLPAGVYIVNGKKRMK